MHDLLDYLLAVADFKLDFLELGLLEGPGRLVLVLHLLFLLLRLFGVRRGLLDLGLLGVLLLFFLGPFGVLVGFCVQPFGLLFPQRLAGLLVFDLAQLVQTGVVPVDVDERFAVPWHQRVALGVLSGVVCRGLERLVVELFGDLLEVLGDLLAHRAFVYHFGELEALDFVALLVELLGAHPLFLLLVQLHQRPGHLTRAQEFDVVRDLVVRPFAGTGFGLERGVLLVGDGEHALRDVLVDRQVGQRVDLVLGRERLVLHEGLDVLRGEQDLLADLGALAGAPLFAFHEG